MTHTALEPGHVRAHAAVARRGARAVRLREDRTAEARRARPAAGAGASATRAGDPGPNAIFRLDGARAERRLRRRLRRRRRRSSTEHGTKGLFRSTTRSTTRRSAAARARGYDRQGAAPHDRACRSRELEAGGRRLSAAATLGRCPSCPRSRPSAATSRPTSRAACWRRWRCSTRAGARPLAGEEVAAACEGRRVEALGRRGKYLIWELEDDVHLMLHLRMTGHAAARPAASRRATARALRASTAGASCLRRPAPLRHRRAGARQRGARRVLRRAARRRAALARLHQRAPVRAHARRAARRSRRSCSTSARSRAWGTSTPTRRCSARGSTRCAPAGRLTRGQVAALRDAVSRRWRQGSRRRARRSTTSAIPTASRAPSRTAS